jgi:hypothetical protein
MYVIEFFFCVSNSDLVFHYGLCHWFAIRMKQKLKTQPQIPRTLKDQIETIEDDRFTNQPGKSGKLPRKLLRKRKKEEKKQRKRLYHNKIPIPEPAPPKPPREKRPFPAEPPRKKPKLEKPPPSKPIKPAISAEDAEIAYYERKLKRKGSKKTHSQLDGNVLISSDQV